MKRYQLLGVLFLACTGVFLIGRQAGGQTENENDKIRALLTEKRDALQTRLDYTEKLFEVGSAKQERLLQARDDVFDVELELADTREKRIAVLTQRLENRRALEALQERRFQDGTVGFDLHLIARASRIDSEIDLLREQSRE